MFLYGLPRGWIGKDRMLVEIMEFFLKGLACFGTVAILLWIVRWESASYTAFAEGRERVSSSFFYIIKLFSRNKFFNQSSYVIAFLSLFSGFLLFAVFPLCEKILWDGREIFTEYYRTENGMAIVLIGIILNHIFVDMVKNYRHRYSGQSMHIASRLSGFISSIGILVVILLSLFLTYESFNFHDIVRQQDSFSKYGIFLQPVAALLFLGCIHIDSNVKIFSIFEKNHYHEIDGVEIFFLKLMVKARWLCFIVLYVFLFLGGYSLLPGLDYVVSYFPKALHISQLFSLILKASLVAFIMIVIKLSFLEKRDIDINRLAFGKLIPIAFVNFIITMGMKIY